jgi:hypothetical protein
MDLSTGVRAAAKYTTRELIRLKQMANQAIWLSQRSSHAVNRAVLSGVSRA